MGSPDASGRVDLDYLASVIQRYPVRLAVLFGSSVSGMTTAESDVDVAVTFDERLTRIERLEARIDLVVDLVEALGRDDVDVADLDGIRPAVGLSALRSGTVVVGNQHIVDEYLERFEREGDDEETHDDRMRRFDSLLERLEGQV